MSTPTPSTIAGSKVTFEGYERFGKRPPVEVEVVAREAREAGRVKAVVVSFFWVRVRGGADCDRTLMRGWPWGWGGGSRNCEVGRPGESLVRGP